MLVRAKTIFAGTVEKTGFNRQKFSNTQIPNSGEKT
jgi:hypothetical protein